MRLRKAVRTDGVGTEVCKCKGDKGIKWLTNLLLYIENYYNVNGE